MIPDRLRHRGTDSRFPRWQWVLCRAWMQFWMRRRDVSSSQPRGTQVAANSSSAPAAAGQRLRPAAGVCQRLRVQILKVCDTADFESLRYSTSSSAPWQLKPAPKEDIHQRPPGALPPRAACRTKRTKGLLRFPQSRSTAALQRRSSSVSASILRRCMSTSRPPACMIHAAICPRAAPCFAITSENSCSAYFPASSGTGCVRMLRSIPPLVSKRR